jgi:hypothetical protein
MVSAATRCRRRSKCGCGPGRASASVDALAARLRQMPGVADVRYDRQWLNRVLSAIDVIRGVGLVLGSVLTIAAALTVANVVRLALYARATSSTSCSWSARRRRSSAGRS